MVEASYLNHPKILLTLVEQMLRWGCQCSPFALEHYPSLQLNGVTVPATIAPPFNSKLTFLIVDYLSLHNTLQSVDP